MFLHCAAVSFLLFTSAPTVGERGDTPLFLLQEADLGETQQGEFRFWQVETENESGQARVAPVGRASAISWCLVRTGSTQHNLHDLAATPAGRLMIELDTLDTALVGFELEPHVVDGVLVVRCGIAIVGREESGQRGGGHLLALTGQSAQIRPLIDPTSLVAPCDLLVEVLLDTIDPAGRSLTAINVQTGEVVITSLDGAGMGRVGLPSSGQWGLSVSAHEPLSPHDASGPATRQLAPTLTITVQGTSEVDDE